MNRKRGFTLIELLTVMAIIALLVGLLLPALAQARAKALMIKDQSMIKEIHQAWVAFARQYDGRYPTPGLINRLPDPLFNNQRKPGRGPEDIELNNSGNMYSACIMANYFTPDILVGPTEPSGFVAVKDDYDWSVYSPTECYYWDTNCDGEYNGQITGYQGFAVRLDKEKHSIGDLLCNTSYAHSPIARNRQVTEWRDTANADWPVIGTRGVRNGDDSPGSQFYKESVTLEFFGRKEWWGNICFNDNHVDLLRTFYPEGVNYLEATTGETTSVPDNIFRNDVMNGDDTSGDGHDAWLTLVSSIDDPTGLTITTEWD